ncbi:hypothetical protein Agub_g12806 [Astrephomene gubernaculifera]|uniref:Uncharacterized protein n=1 Tax=Astrephomene gubernaculifera TaxID=47775 RepID=A0AAD3E372_9CHLO|nr:hypothetical protein Agub_g12806 [Astrephomene gubernaculifera]
MMLKGTAQACPRQHPRAFPHPAPSGLPSGGLLRPAPTPATPASQHSISPPKPSTHTASTPRPVRGPAAAAPAAAAAAAAAGASWVCAAAPPAAPAAAGTAEGAGASLPYGTAATSLVDTSVVHYRCHSRDGAMVDARVEQLGAGSGWQVTLAVSYLNVPQRAPGELQLHWGMYRANPTRWQHPPEVQLQLLNLPHTAAPAAADSAPAAASALAAAAPAAATPAGQQAAAGGPGEWQSAASASSPDPGGSGALRTPLGWDKQGLGSGSGCGGCWRAVLRVPQQLGPLHLAFALYQPATKKYDIPLRAAHFCVPVGMSAGSPEPLGAAVVATATPTGSSSSSNSGSEGDPRVTECAVNFAVFSRHATSMQLCLVRVRLPEQQQQQLEGGGGGGAAGGGGGGSSGGSGGRAPAGSVAEATNVLEVVFDPLTNRTGDVWHVCVHGLKDLGTLCWAWRADGEILWQNGNRFHPGFMLLDPWATRVLPVSLPPGAHRAAPRMPPPPPAGQPASPEPPVLLGSLAAFTQPPFDWQGCHQPLRSSTPRATPAAAPAAAPTSTGGSQGSQGSRPRPLPLESGLVVEVDVVRFTSGPEAEGAVPPERRGKYLGVLDRLDQLRALGATTILLTPVNLCGSIPASSSSPSTAPLPAGSPPPPSTTATPPTTPTPAASPASAAASLDGRAPLSYFAPDPSLAVGGPLAAAEELKGLIRGLHRAGLEVMLQVEFCLTAEGGDAEGAGRLQGLRGLDHAVYYREGLTAPVLNCGHPVVRQLVGAALRHWAAEYRVGGFCVRNAENLVQDKFGSVLDSPPLVEQLAGDPQLRGLKLLAAVSEPALLPRQGERGFPHWGVWLQVNDRFRTDLTAYLAAGQRGLLSAVATRLTGSADLFAARWDAGLPGGLAAGRRPAFGVNATAPLGDRPLQAVLAAAAAAACGATDPARCEAVARALLVAQFVSAGQPLVAAATLLARPSTAQLVAALAAVRRGYAPLLCPPSLTSAERVLTWHSPYSGAGEPDWAAANPDPTANVLVLTIGGGVSRPGHMLTVAFNPNAEPVTVALPPPPTVAAAAPFCWRLLVDTSRPVPTAAQPAGPRGGGSSLGVVLPASEQGSYVMGAYGAVLLDAVPAQQQQPQQQQVQATATATAAAPSASTGGPAGRPATPPPGYGMSPAAAAAASKPPQPPAAAYKTVGGSSSAAPPPAA